MPSLCTRQVGAAFAELICADEQWLRDEFDALIAANYRPPSPPPAPPCTPPHPPRRLAPATGPAPGPGRPQADSSRPGARRQRQRSPPLAETAH